jgi:hypothetical protein
LMISSKTSAARDSRSSWSNTSAIFTPNSGFLFRHAVLSILAELRELPRQRWPRRRAELGPPQRRVEQS